MTLLCHLPNKRTPTANAYVTAHPSPCALQCTCSLPAPALNVTSSPCVLLLLSLYTPILPLVSLMNGFTAGKVLIFIPLSDFCWLLLISNTQRKASESINKEMNTLHPAIQRASQSLTRGPLWRPGLHLVRHSLAPV